MDLRGEGPHRHWAAMCRNNRALLTDVWASLKTLDTIHSTCSQLFFSSSCSHKLIIDISTLWLWHECPVNTTALIISFNKACTADFCWFYVVIKQKSICLPPSFSPRFSMCKPYADQMVTIYFAQGSLKASHYNKISHFSLALALKFSLALLYSLQLTSTCPKAWGLWSDSAEVIVWIAQSDLMFRALHICVCVPSYCQWVIWWPWESRKLRNACSCSDGIPESFTVAWTQLLMNNTTLDLLQALLS